MEGRKEKEKFLESITETSQGNDEGRCNKILRFVPAKVTSYFYFGSKYLLMTYLVPFFISIGLHPSQAGLIISMRYLVQVLGGVFLSTLADRSKKHTLIALIAVIITTCSMVAMPILPYVYHASNGTIISTTEQLALLNTVGNQTIEKNNRNSQTWKDINHEIKLITSKKIQKNKTDNQNTHLDKINGTGYILLSDNKSKTSESVPMYQKQQMGVNKQTQLTFIDTQKLFCVVIFFSLLYAFFDGSLNGMVDAVTISYCDYYGDKDTYYWQRLWGSIGYATMPLFGGIVLDLWSYTQKPFEFVPIFYVFYFLQFILFCFFIFLLNGFSKIQKKEKLLREITPELNYKSSRQIIKETVTNPKILICLILQIAFGIGTGIEFSYLLLYMENYMINGTKSILGFSVLSQCLIEAIFSPLMGRITKVISDPYVCMALGLTGYAVGFFLYYCATHGWHIIFINLLYGISYLLFNFPAQTECYRLCPKKYLTVLFSLSASCYTGIGCAIGGLLGGILYEKNGPRNMYLITSFIFQSSAVVLFIYCAVRYKKRQVISEEEDKVIYPVDV